MENSKEKKDDELDFNLISKSIIATTYLMIFTAWIFNARKYISFIASLVGSAWMSLLIFYIWTEKLILLKIWATPIVIGLILWLIIDAFDELKKKPLRKLKQDEVFGNGKGTKYVVIDEKDPLKGQEVILYPFRGRLTHEGKQINFYNESQIKEVKNNENV